MTTGRVIVRGFGVLIAVPAILLAVVAVAVALGERRWERQTEELLRRMRPVRDAGVPNHVSFAALAGLPAPAQRYLRSVLVEGAPLVASAELSHQGTFNMSDQAPQWRRFTSRQWTRRSPPGFVWDARISMVPGVPVRVHDAYVAEEGVLTAAIGGLLQVADVRGGAEIAEGELMRYLAESPWYPTALLPRGGVAWEAVDGSTARASLTDGHVTATLYFEFGDDGLVGRVYAPARSRIVDGRLVPTPWEGRFWNYSEMSGMRVPVSGEVAWRSAEGLVPYWRADITAARYGFGR